MTFWAPFWLVGLLPWAAVVVWLLSGRREGTDVPFLHLWRGTDAAPPRPRVQWQVPPVQVICAMLAMALAIVGAARPVWVASEKDSTRPRTAPYEPRNAAIVSAAAAQTPRPQVMVRVRNDSDLSTTELKVGLIRKTIDLPPRGQERNYFVDLDELGASTSIELVVEDDIAADNLGTLFQTRAWPVIETRGILPAEVERMIETYAKIRPAGAGSSRVVATGAMLSPQQAGVIVAAAGTSVGPGNVRIESNPINANVDWTAITAQELRVAPPPGEGWQTIAAIGDHPLVAVRTAPARQVWVGIGGEAWGRSTGFVIVWTNVLDWVGQGGETFAFEQSRSHATAPATRPANPILEDAGIDITPPILLSAGALIFLAAALWGTCKNCAAG